jgi:hypothetical protein
LDSVEGSEELDRNPRSGQVLRRYINGRELNAVLDFDRTRWVVDFNDRDEADAASYSDLFGIVRSRVLPGRLKAADGHSEGLKRVGKYWQFARRRPEMREAISDLSMVTLMAQSSSTVIPMRLANDFVFDQKLVVFASEDSAFFALLASGVHYFWVRQWSSTLKSDVSYTPSDGFETFPLPELTQEMRDLGDTLDTYRRNVMLSRQTGLTKTYNLVFDLSVHDEDIVEVRRIHKAIDEATVRAYGWDDLLDKLDHGFHPAGRDLRYTIGPTAQREILDRLLELNHERYVEEVKLGLHDKKKGKKAAKAQADTAEGLF